MKALRVANPDAGLFDENEDAPQREREHRREPSALRKHRAHTGGHGYDESQWAGAPGKPRVHIGQYANRRRGDEYDGGELVSYGYRQVRA